MGQNLSSSNIEVPTGFRFQPTKEELINNYLKVKNEGNHSDVDNYIVTIDNLLMLDPSELPVLCFKPWDAGIYSYFFCKWNQYGKGNQVGRTTKTGSWKKTGKDLLFPYSNKNNDIGKRIILGFHRGRSSSSPAEYTLHVFEMINHSSNQGEPYTLCRLNKNAIETKKKKKKNKVGTPNRVGGKPIGDSTLSDFEMSSSRSDGIGEQNNGSFSQSPGSTVVDGDEISFDAANGNIPLATAESQPEYGQAPVGNESLTMYLEPLYSPNGHCEMQAMSGFAESEQPIEELLNMFCIPQDGSWETMGSVFDEPNTGHFQVNMDNGGAYGPVESSSLAPPLANEPL